MGKLHELRRARLRAAVSVLVLAMTVGLAPSVQALGPKSAQPPKAPEGAGEVASDKVLAKVRIDQKLGEAIPFDLEFTDPQGVRQPLGNLIGERPVVLALVYYECPMLCTMVLNGLLRMMNVLKFDAGKEFDVVTVSIDPRETPELAAEKKKKYLDRYRRDGAERGWHFLVGDEPEIAKLTTALGYHYAYDETTDQFAHGSAIMVLTPDGKISRYFYGIEYSPIDVRLSLVEASDEGIGTLTDAILLSCFQYNPLDGKYSLAIMRLVRGVGVLTVVGILAFIFISHLRERRRTKAQASAASVARAPGS